MAAVLVQSKTGSGAGGSTNIVLDSTPTSGNVLIFKHGQGSNTTLCSQPTGGGVTTWASVTSNTRRACRQSYGVIDTTPSATVNFNNNFLPGSWTLEEWSGLDTASLVQGSSVNNGQGATASAAHTPTASSDVMLGANAAIQNAATSNVGGGFTDILGSGSIGPSAYLAVTGASGAYTPSWSCTNVFTVWDAITVAYNVASAGGPDYTLTVDAGSYTQTGNAVGLLASRLLGVTAGSYALTGNVVGLYHNRVLGISAGSYALTGNAVGLLASRVLGVNAGAYVVTGNDVTLTYSGAAGPTYTLTVAGGTYALTGNAVGLLLSRVLPVAQGAYVVTGNAVGLLRQYTLAVAAGSYGIAGNPLGLVASRVLPLSSGSYVVTGNDISLTVRVPGAVVRGLWFTR